MVAEKRKNLLQFKETETLMRLWVSFFFMMHKSLNPEVNIASQLHENGWKSQENTVAAKGFISKESCSLQILIVSVAVIQFYYVYM